MSHRGAYRQLPQGPTSIRKIAQAQHKSSFMGHGPCSQIEPFYFLYSLPQSSELFPLTSSLETPSFLVVGRSSWSCLSGARWCPAASCRGRPHGHGRLRGKRIHRVPTAANKRQHRSHVHEAPHTYPGAPCRCFFFQGGARPGVDDRGQRAEDSRGQREFFQIFYAFKEERGTKNERREKHQLPYIFPLLVWAHAPLV
jgi:hypothetical protein